MGCVKFLTDNYADPDLYANLIVSSANASFPSSNALAKQRRSKVWRSGGYFKIESGSNTIVFRETTGVDLTATVTAGEYTSTSAFMLAVKSALDTAGDSTYTVTQNSALKFVIASNGSGGGGLMQLRFATSTAMAAILGYDAVNLSGALTYTADFLRIHTSERFTVDMGLPTNITDFALAGLRNSAIKLSPTGTFTLQGSMTDSFGAPEYTSALTYDEEVMYKTSTSGLHTEPLRYWSLKLVDQNPYGYVEVGALFFGNNYSPTYGTAQFPFTSDLDDRSTVIFSEGGQSFSNIKEKSQNYDVNWLGVRKDELDEFIDIYSRYGKSYPFFIMLDSEATYFSSVNQSIKYVKFSEDIRYELVSPNNFRVSMKFREEI